MKSDIHPEYTANATIACACGNTMTVGSTLPEISIEICSNCHPFYTGKQKLVDTAGRLEKFQAKVAAKDSVSVARIGKKAKRTRETAKKAANSEA